MSEQQKDDKKPAEQKPSALVQPGRTFASRFGVKPVIRKVKQ